MITPAQQRSSDSSTRASTTEAAEGLRRRSGRRPGKAIWGFFAERCKRVLLDLANVRHDCGYFRRRWGTMFLRGEADSEILSLQDRLRAAWEAGTESLDLLSHQLVTEIELAPKATFVGCKWMEFTLLDRTVLRVPNFFTLPMALSIAIVELAPQLAVCPNPECPQRYFAKIRSTQRFCELRACVQFGQRQYKRDWWKEYGGEWRKSRGKKSSRSKSKGRGAK